MSFGSNSWRLVAGDPLLNLGRGAAVLVVLIRQLHTGTKLVVTLSTRAGAKNKPNQVSLAADYFSISPAGSPLLWINVGQ